MRDNFFEVGERHVKKAAKELPPEEKVVILKKHLLEKVPVSDLCAQYGLHPNSLSPVDEGIF